MVRTGEIGGQPPFPQTGAWMPASGITMRMGRAVRRF